MSKNVRFYIIIGLFLPLFFHPSGLFADQTFKPMLINTPITLDGDLDEAVWQQLPKVSNFKTYQPDFGKDPIGETEAMMAYDDKNLYFAFNCFDPEVDKIKTSVADRDKIIPDDWVCVNLDTFNDKQALTAFYVNPDGIQGDSRFSANNEDFSIDYVWYSAGKRTLMGFSIEIEIPLKSIRYSDGEPVTMGIVFERYISRNTEHSTYPPLDPAKGAAFLVEMMPIEFPNLEHYTLLELLPAFTYSNKSKLQQGTLERYENKPDLSLTMKYGVTSQLILDGAINPDFSQIESDAGQVDVNLRTDLLYYSEKRPFFLEGNEAFRIASSGLSEIDPLSEVVHTRNIINPFVGVKLSGKIGPQTTINSIYALDELPDDLNMGKYSHYPIVRLKQSLSEDSYFGGVYAGKIQQDSYNQLIGADEMIRLPNSAVVESHILLSQTKQEGASESNSGHAFSANYAKQNRDIDYNISFKDISEDFSADMGYLARTGIQQAAFIVRPKYYPKSDFFQRIAGEFVGSVTKDKPSNLWETYNYIVLQPYFLGNMNIRMKYSYSTEIFLGERFKTGGFHVSAGGQIFKELYVSILYRYISSIYYSANPLQGKSNRASADLTFQPSDQISLGLSFLFSDFTREIDDVELYNYPIWRGKFSYQVNKYFSLRAIGEYNKFRRELLTDFLASFTYIPGTVMYLGYGSFYQKLKWENNAYVDSDDFKESQRGIFFKLSYLWRS